MADLRRRVARDDLQFLFVSVDPERDTPEVIRRYLAHFDPALVGATGTRAEIERFTAGLGLAQVVNPGVGGEYTVDHSTAFVLIDPRGTARRLLPGAAPSRRARRGPRGASAK